MFVVTLHRFCIKNAQKGIFKGCCAQSYKKMTETLIITVLIIAIAVLLLSAKVILKKNGSFASQHIHDSEAMKSKGIHCVMDQDREMRTRSHNAVNEKSR